MHNYQRWLGCRIKVTFRGFSWCGFVSREVEHNFRQRKRNRAISRWYFCKVRNTELTASIEKPTAHKSSWSFVRLALHKNHCTTSSLLTRLETQGSKCWVSCLASQVAVKLPLSGTVPCCICSYQHERHVKWNMNCLSTVCHYLQIIWFWTACPDNASLQFCTAMYLWAASHSCPVTSH